MAIDSFFKNLMQSPSAQGALGGAASGAVVSLLMNKKARKKLGKTAATVGGVAAVAGLGYYAYQKWQRSKGVPVAASSSPQTSVPAPQSPSLQQAAQDLQLDPTFRVALILAMIAAAAADGAIDRTEMDHLFESMEGAGLTAEENAKLTSALNKPPTAEEIASLAAAPEQASELYAASLSAVDLDTPAEDFYLRRLARAMKLEPSLVSQLHMEAQALTE